MHDGYVLELHNLPIQTNLGLLVQHLQLKVSPHFLPNRPTYNFTHSLGYTLAPTGPRILLPTEMFVVNLRIPPGVTYHPQLVSTLLCSLTQTLDIYNLSQLRESGFGFQTEFHFQVLQGNGVVADFVRCTLDNTIRFVLF